MSLTTEQTKSRPAVAKQVYLQLNLSFNWRKKWKKKVCSQWIIQTFVGLRLYHSSGLHHWRPLGYLGDRLEANMGGNAKVNSSLTYIIVILSMWESWEIGNNLPSFLFPFLSFHLRIVCIFTQEVVHHNHFSHSFAVSKTTDHQTWGIHHANDKQVYTERNWGSAPSKGLKQGQPLCRRPSSVWLVRPKLDTVALDHTDFTPSIHLLYPTTLTCDDAPKQARRRQN